MSKNIIIILVILLIVIIAVSGWWFFHRTNSTIANPTTNSTTNTKTVNLKSSEKLITSFTFSGLESKVGTAIDNAKHTVILVVPHSTDITGLIPVISISNFAVISPNSGIAQNFTKPIVYTVTAQDGSTQDYTVTVEIATAKGFGGS